MPQAALNALISTYLEQATWLDAWASEYEKGTRRVISANGVDLSQEAAIELRHKAGNMRAVIQAYQRLTAKDA